nr:uncharacterized protein LOC127328477 [Lolium perenne]
MTAGPVPAWGRLFETLPLLNPVPLSPPPIQSSPPPNPIAGAAGAATLHRESGRGALLRGAPGGSRRERGRSTGARPPPPHIGRAAAGRCCVERSAGRVFSHLEQILPSPLNASNWVEEEEWSSLNICLEDAEGAKYFADLVSCLQTQSFWTMGWRMVVVLEIQHLGAS